MHFFVLRDIYAQFKYAQIYPLEVLNEGTDKQVNKRLQKNVNKKCN